MTAVRGKPSGFGVHDKLTSVIMEIIDSQLPQLVDGLGGGTYTPSAPIVIAGTHGLSCTGVVAFSGSVACNANTVTFNGSTCALVGSSLTVDATSNITTAVGSLVTCNGSTTFNGTVTHNESFSLNSSKTFSCAGTLALGGSGSITGTAGSTVSLTGTAIALGAGTAVTFAAGTTVANAGASVTNSGTANTSDRMYIPSHDSIETVGVTTGTYATSGADVVWLDNGVYSAARTVTLTSAGARAGSRVRFWTNDPTHRMTIKNDGGSILALLLASSATSGDSQWVEFMYTGGAWVTIGDHVIP